MNPDESQVFLSIAEHEREDIGWGEGNERVCSRRMRARAIVCGVCARLWEGLRGALKVHDMNKEGNQSSLVTRERDSIGYCSARTVC